MTILALVEPATHITLADDINEQHRLCVESYGSTLDHALACGNLLHQARLQIEHGQWAGWITGNFHGSDRTARQYMQLATATREGRLSLDDLAGQSIAAATKAITTTTQPRQPAEPSDTPAQHFTLTADQLVRMVHAFGGTAPPEKVLRWIERLKEPRMTVCPDCQEPVIEVVIRKQVILAERDSWLERGQCTKCLQTRNSHPDLEHVHCPHCNDTGFTGTRKRPQVRMLALDMAWGDEDHARVIGPTTDRRKGEALHPIHQCAVEVAA